MVQEVPQDGVGVQPAGVVIQEAPQDGVAGRLRGMMEVEAQVVHAVVQPPGVMVREVPQAGAVAQPAGIAKEGRLLRRGRVTAFSFFLRKLCDTLAGSSPLPAKIVIG